MFFAQGWIQCESTVCQQWLAAKHRLRWAVIRRLLPCPVLARHAECSFLLSEDDSGGWPCNQLIDLSVHAIQEARHIDLTPISARMAGRFSYPDSLINVWPGEHYRLLAGLCRTLVPDVVVEIGTGEGLSALSMLASLPPSAKLVTFDVIPWHRYPRVCFLPEDFQGGRLKQITGDLSNEKFFATQAELLSQAELLFLDAPKDGCFEPRFLSLLRNLKRERTTVLVLDDIRQLNMLKVWRELALPRLDMTSFGHFTGTGLALLAVESGG